MNRLVKKFMVVLMSAFMFLGAVTTPVQAKGPSSDNPNGWGFWWGWWWPTEPTPEPTPEPVEEPVVDEEPGADEETPVETEEPVVEETPVETEEPVVEETPAAEPEPVYAEGTFFDESEHFVATVSFDATAKLPEGTDVSVSELQEGTPEYDAAVEAVFGDSEAAADFIAVDISLVKDGVAVEPDPNGNEVTVSVELKNLPAEAIEAADTMEIQHVNEVSGETETVATAENITVTGEDSASAEFAVGSFSTFVLKWGDNSATIHYGYIKDGTFTEFANEKVAVLDTTAASVSLENYFDGYSYSTANYVASEGAEPITIDPILYKTDNGWSADMHSNNDDSSSVTRTAIANGSHIFVVYAEPKHNDKSPDDVAGPTTTKKVIDNGDGTYTIQLDVLGAVKTETHSTGANVLIILDRTTSMTWSMKGRDYSITTDNPERWATAVSAIKTLVNTLSTGENAGNDIDYSLVTFYRKADDIYKWSGNSWTKNYSAYLETIDGLDQNSGTNWEAGLTQGYNALANRDSDKTYVIFVTDGEPNASNTSHNPWDWGWSYVTDAQEEANSIAATKNVSLYGVFCGGDAGVDNLTNIITNAGGVKTINGTDEKTMQDEFKNIAQTIIDNLGSSDVSVDDGIPSLSSVSAQTVGEASGFEYYIANTENPSDSDFTKWDKAPGASYSKDNGVTWDLSSVGNLADKTTYRLKFTVWPSQAAYDLIADLNNKIITMTEAELTEKGIVYEGGVYKLKTNTHLETTYTYNGSTYTDPSTWNEEKMLLPSESITINKEWANGLDPDDRFGANISVYLKRNDSFIQKDDKNWEIPLVYDEATKESNSGPIYIAPGFMNKDEDGNLTIRETGYDYTIAEKPSESYYWELTSDVYHPMVENGKLKVLKLVTDTTGVPELEENTTDGTYYRFNNELYIAADGENVLSAKNDRRSYLNLTKEVDGEGAPADALFTYNVKITDSQNEDVWFSIENGSVMNGDYDVNDYVVGAVPEIRELNPTDNPKITEVVFHKADDTYAYDYYTYKYDEKPYTVRAADDGSAEPYKYYTGYYSAASEAALTLKIRANWNVRFINLVTGTKYSFEEQNSMDPGFVFDSAAATANGTELTGVVTNAKADGTIEKANTDYTVTYTNKYLGCFYVYHSSNNTVERIYMTDNRVTRVKNEETGAFTFTFDIIAEVLTENADAGIKYLYGGYYSDYAGKSDGYDSTAVTEWDENNWYTDNGTNVKPYIYANIVRDNSGWDYAKAYDVNGFNAVVEKDETYYLKEVPTGYLSPYTHYTYKKSTYDIVDKWAISAIDDANYQQSGFVIVDANKKAKVCKSLTVVNKVGGPSVKLESQKVFAKKQIQSGYLIYLKLSDPEVNIDPTGKTILQYWVTKDGIRVTGTTSRKITKLTNKKTGVAYTDNTAAANSTCVEFTGNN